MAVLVDLVSQSSLASTATETAGTQLNRQRM